MDLSKHNDLLYKYEILRARLEIRDHYFNTIVREIYENTGQVLSLARVQLAIAGNQVTSEVRAEISKSGHLIGQAIFELREMSKKFFPEKEILSESGLVSALKRELRINKDDESNYQLKVEGVPFALTPENGMVFFFVVLEIVNHIITLYGLKSIELSINYSDTRLNLVISYSGQPIDFDVKDQVGEGRNFTAVLGVKERIRLIGGEFIIANGHQSKAIINISIPYDENKAA